MVAYAISSRRISGQGAQRRFDDEPGSLPSFLISPEGAAEFSPEHIVKGGKNAGALWTKQLLDTFQKDDQGRYTGDLVFLVHGFNVDAADAYAAHKEFGRNLTKAGFAHTLVSYDWPAKGDLTNYLEDSSDAFKTAPILVQSGIALFARASGPECRVKVHVVAHSMGAFVTREAFRQAKGHPPASLGAWGVTQLVLIAADISAGSIHTDLSEEMCAKAQRITSYYSRYDAALATSNVKRFASSPRLGRHGSENPSPKNVIDVDCSDRWLSYSKTDPNTNFVRDLGLSHTWYFQDTDRFYPDLAGTLIGDIDRSLLTTRETIDGRLRLKPA